MKTGTRRGKRRDQKDCTAIGEKVSFVCKPACDSTAAVRHSRRTYTTDELPREKNRKTLLKARASRNFALPLPHTSCLLSPSPFCLRNKRNRCRSDVLAAECCDSRLRTHLRVTLRTITCRFITASNNMRSPKTLAQFPFETRYDISSSSLELITFRVNAIIIFFFFVQISVYPSENSRFLLLPEIFSDLSTKLLKSATKVQQISTGGLQAIHLRRLNYR